MREDANALRRIGQRLGSLRPLAPLGCLVVLYVLSDLAKNYTGIERFPRIHMGLMAVDPANLAQQSARFAALMNFAVSALVYVAAWLACVFVMTGTLCRISARWRSQALLLPLLGLGLVLCGPWLALTNPMTTTPMIDLVSAALKLDFGDSGDRWLYGANGLGISVALLFALSAGVALAPVRGEKSEVVRGLRMRMMRVDRCLYFAAAFLVAGVVHAHAMHMYSGPLLADADAGHLAGLTRAVTTALGSLWTLVLLAIYVPTASILRRDARLAAEGLKSPAPSLQRQDGWLKAHGLDASLVKQVGSLAAAVSPLVAGATGLDFLKIFGG